jgi:hypothetical protein
VSSNSSSQLFRRHRDNPPTQTKALTLTTANPLTHDQAAQVITFTYIIKNSGTGIWVMLNSQ